MRKKTRYFWRQGLWAVLSFLFLSATLLAFVFFYLQRQLPDVEFLKTIKLQVPLKIYTKEGQLIQEFGEKRRIPLAYEEIPPRLIQAVLATEDQRFFEHAGVDLLGLGRATLSMIQTGEKSQGGSTITMQVARNFFLTRKKTFLRKFNEILLAIKIDRELSKEKILELYLNTIYFGNRAYGVGAAAEVYYGKSLKDLDLAELAMIAGLPQAPSAHNPIVNPLAAKKRRDHVLERLYDLKIINEGEYQQALKKPITTQYHRTVIEVPAPYVAEMIRQTMYEHFGQQAYTKGYKVFTTIHADLQRSANEKVAEHLIRFDQRHGYRGPVAKLGGSLPHSPEALHELLAQYPVMNGLEPAVITAVSTHSAEAVGRLAQKMLIPWEGIAWARPALKKGWMGKAPKSAKAVLAVGDIVYLRREFSTRSKKIEVDEQEKHTTSEETPTAWVLTQIPQVEGALVAMDPKDGALESLVGGFSFLKSKFNRVTQSERQPGSSFKPFIYAAALEKGYSLATLVNDAPIVVEDPSQAELWRPHNDNQTFKGPMRLKAALVLSRNLVSIRVLDDIGFDYAINFASRFGFHKEKLPKALSLALGTLTVSPLELTSAYAVFANGGFKVEPYLIDKITDHEGKVLLQAKPSIAVEAPLVAEETALASEGRATAPRVISAELAFLMDSALKGVIQQGTARAARALNRPDLAGKTGTTNNHRDAWFAGYHPDLVVTAWIGYDNPESLHEYATHLALPLWMDFMKTTLAQLPLKQPLVPETIVPVAIDPKSGLLAAAGQSNAVIEYFRKQEVPLESSSSQPAQMAGLERPEPEESLF